MSEPERVGDIAMRVLAELLEREFPVTEGNGGTNRGKIGAQIKTAPAVELVPPQPGPRRRSTDPKGA